MSDPNPNNPTLPQPATPPTPGSSTPQPNEPPASGVGNEPPANEPPKSPLNEDKNKEPPADPFDADKLTLPEGMEKNEVYDEFTNFAKEAGFKHSDAQKLLEMSAKAIKAQSEAIYGQWHTQQREWLDKIKADPELGPNLEGLRQTFAKVADNRELTDPEFRAALDFTGAGTHPAVVRTLIRWAKALSEGGLVTGSPADRNRQSESRSAAERLYPGGPHTGGPKLG